MRHRTLQAESTAIEGYLTGGFADPRVLRTPEGAPQTSRNVALVRLILYSASNKSNLPVLALEDDARSTCTSIQGKSHRLSSLFDH